MLGMLRPRQLPLNWELFARAMPKFDPDLVLQRYRSLFEQTNDAVFIIDTHGNHLEVNRRAVEMFGYELDELLNMHTSALVAPDEVSASSKVLGQLIEGRQFPIYERRFRRKDGTVITAEINVAMIRDADGQPLYVQSVVRDVTSRKQQEHDRLESERLRIALEKERELNALKSDLMVTIAHEFRTPLSLILLQRDLLERYFNKLTDVQRSIRLEIIRTQVYRLTSMLDDLNFLVKGTMDALEVRPAVVDASSYFASMIADFRALIGTARIIDFKANVGQSLICLDLSLARRILTNLLLNAVRYSSEHSEIRVELHLIGDHVQITVRDQGIGIPPDDLPHIYDPFFRGSNLKNERGTGLGLSIVARAVELCGGSIDVTSVVGQGTEFFVTLPQLDGCPRPPAG